ncbi:polar amino acid transport system substrate-binding protein [Collimonas sp. OK307]|uniref:hypothetical protein n=1 Tax=Collimonas sp. OK307 TaxID=1801620 RepID=UPI0008E44502|nr:hypothetical protein [Collimonas sp. OK307]SFH74265.1 polar amino acid transport system substrate-binding protein [Collimonas sp. OK307]
MKFRLLYFLTVSLLAIGLCACEKPADTAPTPKVHQVGMNAAFAPFGSVGTNDKI